MWSLLQYRRIRNDVERDWQRHALPPHSRDRSEDRGSRQEINRESLPDIEVEPAQSCATQPLSTDTNKPPTDSSSTTHHDSGRHNRILVKCISDDDPLDPHNWSLLTRARSIATLCLLVFVQAYAGSSDSLTNTKASEDFGVSKVAENLSTAMYLFGIGSGCLFAGPLSETFGRNPVYLTFSFVYLFFVLGTALSRTFASQIICRYFVGLAASATMGINGASVGDMFRPVKRALWFPLIAWANVVRKSSLQIPWVNQGAPDSSQLR